MRATPEQNVDVHLPGCNQQRIRVAGRDDGMAVCEANAQATMVDNLGEREVRGVDIEITFDHLQVGGYLAEEVIGLAVGQVAQTKDLTDLSGCKELAELASGS